MIKTTLAVIGAGVLLCKIFNILWEIAAEDFTRDGMKESGSENIYCPACGFYCTGKGGLGCIDKPGLIKG